MKNLYVKTPHTERGVAAEAGADNDWTAELAVTQLCKKMMDIQHLDLCYKPQAVIDVAVVPVVVDSKSNGDENSVEVFQYA